MILIFLLQLSNVLSRPNIPDQDECLSILEVSDICWESCILEKDEESCQGECLRCRMDCTENQEKTCIHEEQCTTEFTQGN